MRRRTRWPRRSPTPSDRRAARQASRRRRRQRPARAMPPWQTRSVTQRPRSSTRLRGSRQPRRPAVVAAVRPWSLRSSRLQTPTRHLGPPRARPPLLTTHAVLRREAATQPLPTRARLTPNTAATRMTATTRQALRPARPAADAREGAATAASRTTRLAPRPRMIRATKASMTQLRVTYPALRHGQLPNRRRRAALSQPRPSRQARPRRARRLRAPRRPRLTRNQQTTTKP